MKIISIKEFEELRALRGRTPSSIICDFVSKLSHEHGVIFGADELLPNFRTPDGKIKQNIGSRIHRAVSRIHGDNTSVSVRRLPDDTVALMLVEKKRID